MCRNVVSDADLDLLVDELVQELPHELAMQCTGMGLGANEGSSPMLFD